MSTVRPIHRELTVKMDISDARNVLMRRIQMLGGRFVRSETNYIECDFGSQTQTKLMRSKLLTAPLISKTILPKKAIIALEPVDDGNTRIVLDVLDNHNFAWTFLPTRKYEEALNELCYLLLSVLQNDQLNQTSRTQGERVIPPSNQFPSKLPPTYQSTGVQLPPYAPQGPKNRSTALVLEILPGLFGFPGFGWIYSGNAIIGLPLLLGALVWNILIACPGIILTGGLGICCAIPMGWMVLAISVLWLNSYTREHTEVFGPQEHSRINETAEVENTTERTSRDAPLPTPTAPSFSSTSLQVMECQKCGTENPTDYRYCGSCGTPLRTP
jgi:hypothetical protein